MATVTVGMPNGTLHHNQYGMVNHFQIINFVNILSIKYFPYIKFFCLVFIGRGGCLQKVFTRI